MQQPSSKPAVPNPTEAHEHDASAPRPADSGAPVTAPTAPVGPVAPGGFTTLPSLQRVASGPVCENGVCYIPGAEPAAGKPDESASNGPSEP